MTARLNPYLNWRHNAREAMTFYRDVFGGELSLMTFAEGGMAEDASENELIMHAQLETPDGFVLMGADTPERMPLAEGSSITVSISGDDGDTLRGYWNALADGGSVTLPLEQAPWGDAFGMLVDRFGIPWMFNLGSASS